MDLVYRSVAYQFKHVFWVLKRTVSMKYDHLKKKRWGCYSYKSFLSVTSSNFQHYEIQINVTDKNTKFSAKSTL